jgi:hypothetical protein
MKNDRLFCAHYGAGPINVTNQQHDVIVLVIITLLAILLGLIVGLTIRYRLV